MIGLIFVQSDKSVISKYLLLHRCKRENPLKKPQQCCEILSPYLYSIWKPLFKKNNFCFAGRCAAAVGNIIFSAKGSDCFDPKNSRHCAFIHTSWKHIKSKYEVTWWCEFCSWLIWSCSTAWFLSECVFTVQFSGPEEALSCSLTLRLICTVCVGICLEL